MKKNASVKKSKAGHQQQSSSPDAAAPQLTKGRWQLIASATLCLLWMSVLAWLAAGH